MRMISAIPMALLLLQGIARADEITTGTQITVRTDETIDLAKWDRGRIYPATIDHDVFAANGD